jgi:hypothetical protein
MLRLPCVTHREELPCAPRPCLRSRSAWGWPRPRSQTRRSRADPSISFEPNGTTNASSKATFVFTVKGLKAGQTIHPTKPVDSTSIGSVNITQFTTKKNQNTIEIVASANVPAGKYTTTVKVNLSDGTSVSGKADVNYQKLAGCCPPCCPPTICPCPPPTCPPPCSPATRESDNTGAESPELLGMPRPVAIPFPFWAL